MRNPMRILHVFGRLDRGGAETMVMNLYRNINRSKIQFDFIIHTLDNCDYSEEIKALGGRIYSIPKYNGKNHSQYKEAWKCFFEEHREYKLLHGHVRSTGSIYLGIAKRYGLITISHSHSISNGVGISVVVKGLLQYNIRYKADYFFACSMAAGEWLFGKKICKKDNFFILKNAIDSKKYIYNEYDRLKKRKELNVEEKFVIGHIGRFTALKNHNFLLDIFKQIHDKDQNSKLLLVGDGELKQSIIQKAQNLNLINDIIFTGVREDIPELLQAIDIFIFPSLNEGLGISAIEAQCSGLKTIVSDNVPKEVKVTDLLEFISLKQKAEFWAENILKYKKNYKRTNTYKDIYEAGYDIKSTSSWMEKFYIDCGVKWEESQS